MTPWLILAFAAVCLFGLNLGLFIRRRELSGVIGMVASLVSLACSFYVLGVAA